MVKDDLAHLDEEPYFVVIRNEKLNNMLRAYAEYLNAVGDFINATDEQTRYKLIAFDIIEMLSTDLGEQIEEAYKVLIENN